MMRHRFRSLLAVLTLAILPPGLSAQPTSDSASNRLVRFDIYVRSDRESAEAVQVYAEQLKRRSEGLEIHLHDVLKSKPALIRLYELAKESGREKPVLPAFNLCGQTYFGFVDTETTGPEIEAFRTANLYTRSSCPKCQQLKAFLPQLQQRWPAIRFVIHDVDRSTSARSTWYALCRSAGSPPGLPTIQFAGRIMVGYQGDDVTGARLDQLIDEVSGTKPTPASSNDHSPAGAAPSSDRTTRPPLSSDFLPQPTVSLVGVPAEASQPPSVWLAAIWLQHPMLVVTQATEPTGNSAPQTDSVPPRDSTTNADSVDESSDAGAEPAFPDGLELPDEASPSEIGGGESPVEVVVDDTIDVPLFGRLSASKLGMPLFTLAIGLVDGFNPCAMWVLVFLLSVLVNIKDRRKIVLIAGTFVLISGLAYFAFMAAWLSFFTLIGLARPVQMTLGVLAVLIGVINIKDFFAFKKGVSLSIPESQKPKLYRRVRAIVGAQYLTAALSGAVALAVIVNMIELLCTAGLPALYTQVLTMQDYTTWQRYAYLMLYIAAYMFDDTMLLVIVVATLSHRKLQEREGRILKLISGLVILILGLVMLFRPEWLQLGS